MKFVAQERKRDKLGRFKAPQVEMMGIFVSQARATDNISRADFTYHIRRIGDKEVPLPANAYRFSFDE